ncbi:MAG: transposase [Ignavibacteriae bacterium]|nr:transposase [Ignavibacteriota bacterium]
MMNFDPVFSCGDRYYFILVDSLKHVIAEHRATLFAYVLMLSHVHLIIALPPGESISDLMRDFKKYTSTRIRQQLEQEGEVAWVERLRANIGSPAHAGPTALTGGVRTSVLTQESNVRRKLLTSRLGTKLQTSPSVGRKRQVFKLWMDRFDDVVIYTEKMLRVKIKYIHDNPVRAGLVQEPEDWKFPSARNYTLGDQSLIYVATDWELSGERQEVTPDGTGRVGKL